MTSGTPRALVTGITGQDGSFLAELLLAEGYEVIGLVRGEPGERALGHSEHLRARLSLVRGDLLDLPGLRDTVRSLRPREIYHLAAPSFIPASWEQPELTMRSIVGSTAALLEAVRDCSPTSRLFVASSGAMFGEAPESPQRESTPCRPTNPYAVAKLAAHQLLGAMRSHHGLFACSGIFFNHESERRPHQFVTRTITHAAAQIKLGRGDEVVLGSLDAVRDWSFAGDVMRGAWLSLQQDEPDDYVFASGVGRTVRELAQAAFDCVGLDAERCIRVEERFVRAPERTRSVGDPSKARERLGWEPRLSFEQLVARMVEADLRELGRIGSCP